MDVITMLSWKKQTAGMTETNMQSTFRFRFSVTYALHRSQKTLCGILAVNNNGKGFISRVYVFAFLKSLGTDSILK